MQLPDINMSHYFLVTARTLNFSAASRELYISRQALTKNIRRMEEMLGGPLFVQEGTHLSLTPMGIQVQQSAFPLMKSWEDFAWSMQHLSDSTQTVLRMAVSQGSMLSLGGVFTPAFRTANPDILFSLEEAPAENVCTMVRLGTVDLGIIGSHPDFLSDFASLCLRHTGIWFLMHESHPLARKDTLHLQDLKDFPVVTPGLHNHLYRYFVRLFSQAGLSPNIAALSSYSLDQGLTHADKGTLYFAFSPEIITPPEGWSVRPLDEPGSDQFGTYLINRLDTPLTGASVKMLRYIKDTFQVDGDLL